MKIVFFIKTLNNSGGTERITTLLANYLVKYKHDVYILTWTGGDKRFFDLDVNVKHRSLFEFEEVNIYKDYFRTLNRYYKFKKDLKPDIVIDVCVALSIVSIPINYFINSKIISWEHFNTNVSWNIITSKLSRRLASIFANRVVVLTETDKLNYQKKFNAKNIDWIPNPITINSIGDISELNNKIVLSIGRFTDQKGFDLLLQAWREVVSIHSDWKLRIIGDGPLQQDLFDLVEGLNLNKFVEFVNPTKYIEPFYKSASIYVMSSRYEGMPLVLLEAKSFGLPIVSFDCPTGPREIIRDGVDGFLVEPENIHELKKSLITLMQNTDLRMSFSKEAIKEREKFTFESFGEKWNRIINS